MKFIVGKKLGMTQVYGEDGNVTPVTVIEAEPNVVVQIKTKDKDKYQAIQFGYGKRKEKNVKKPQKGHFKNLGSFAGLREARLDNIIKRGVVTPVDQAEGLELGKSVDVSVFTPGDVVKVTGLTKGRGFQGAVKRHGFKGMPASHGHRSVQRHVGSIGQRFPQHTLKGMRMAGHMGHAKFTVRGLKVVTIDVENHLIAVKGAVPGNRGGLLMIQAQ